MDNRPNLTADTKYPIQMGRAPQKQKRDRGYNDRNAIMASGDTPYVTGSNMKGPEFLGVDPNTGLLSSTWGQSQTLRESGPQRYKGQSMLSQQMATRNLAGPQLAIERNQKFHNISNHKVAVASLNNIASNGQVQQAAEILKSASSTYPLNKMRIPQMPDRFKIRKKFYDNNIEFTLRDSGPLNSVNNDTLKVESTNQDYRGVSVTRGSAADTNAQLTELKGILLTEMGKDPAMRMEYFSRRPDQTDAVTAADLNPRGNKVLQDLINTRDDKRWYKVTITKDALMQTEAMTSSNAWYDENLYKKVVIGQSVKIGTPTYQIMGSEKPDLDYKAMELYRVPMFAYVIVKYNSALVDIYRSQGMNAMKWQNKLWDDAAYKVAESQINNAARNYVAVLSPQYKSLKDKIDELKADKDVIFDNYNLAATTKGRMGMNNPLSKMRFTNEAVKATIDEVTNEYDAVWAHVSKSKSEIGRPSWGQLKVKHADKLQSITILFQDNHGGAREKKKYDQIRISCNLKEVALTYKAVVSPWVRQISLNHALMVQWKKNQSNQNAVQAYTPTRIFGDRGQEITLPQIMLSRPKYISFKKKKRNLYATWLTLGNWISLANDPNTAAALRFNAVINQDSYLLIRQLEGVLDATLKAATQQPTAANPEELNYHAFHVLFSRVVHKAEPGFKSAGIDGSRHAHYKLFDIGNTKGKYIRLNYANNAIGKKNVINLRARLRQFLKQMKKLNSVNQIFQTKVKDRGFSMNMMEIAGNCVMLSMASKFLPNHDFFTYIDNDDMVEEVKGSSFNTVMQMLTLMQSQSLMENTMGAYVKNITKTIVKMEKQAQQAVKYSFAPDYMRQAQERGGSNASTADSENTNPMVALARVYIDVNYQSGQYNNSDPAKADSYGQSRGLGEAVKITMNSVIRGKQLKQSTVAIIQKDLELFKLGWIADKLPGTLTLQNIEIEQSVIAYDNLLKKFGVNNFNGEPYNMPLNVRNNNVVAGGLVKGSQAFMNMIAYYRGFIEIMDSAGQLFTLYQLRVYKGATDEEFMSFLLYYLEISKQMMVLLLPIFTRLKLDFLWKSTQADNGSTPVMQEPQLNEYVSKNLESKAFSCFEYRIIWGLQDMIGRIRQPSAAGQPSMRTVGYRMTTGSFPDAPIASIAGENKYGRIQQVLIEPNTALNTYDGKNPVQPNKMGRQQLGGNLSDSNINNPHQIVKQYDYLIGGDAQMNN